MKTTQRIHGFSFDAMEKRCVGLEMKTNGSYLSVRALETLTNNSESTQNL